MIDLREKAVVIKKRSPHAFKKRNEFEIRVPHVRFVIELRLSGEKLISEILAFETKTFGTSGTYPNMFRRA